MNTHQILIILVVDTRVLGCVADSLQDCRFASISPTDYKDTKASIFRSEVIRNTVAHGVVGEGKEGLRGTALSPLLWVRRNLPGLWNARLYLCDKSGRAAQYHVYNRERESSEITTGLFPASPESSYPS